MGEAKDQLEFRIKKYGAKVLTAWTIVGAVVTALVGIVGSCWSNYLVRTSEVAVQCRGLEEKCSAMSAELKEKDERINDQRMSIVELKQAIHSRDTLLATKDTQLTVKDSDIDFFKVKFYEREGRMITRNDAEVMKMLGGTIAERIGLDNKMTAREKIEKSWQTPLLVGMLPGVYLPAPKDVVSSFLEMVNSYDRGDYSNAVRQATNIYAKIKTQLDATKAPVVDIDTRFGMVASEVCRIMAEGAFANRDYKRAALLMQKAAGVVGNKPSAKLLALESAMFYRAGISLGHFTLHMAEAIRLAGDKDYLPAIHDELAKLGYLQLYFPDKDGTGIGDEIDWVGMGVVARSSLRPVEERSGDMWSSRWAGFGKYEDYNISEEFRHASGKLKLKRKTSTTATSGGRSSL